MPTSPGPQKGSAAPTCCHHKKITYQSSYRIVYAHYYTMNSLFLSSRSVLLAVTEEVKTWLPFFFRSMYNTTIIRFGFHDIQNNQGLGKILIMLDITKTSSLYQLWYSSPVCNPGAIWQERSSLCVKAASWQWKKYIGLSFRCDSDNLFLIRSKTRRTVAEVSKVFSADP